MALMKIDNSNQLVFDFNPAAPAAAPADIVLAVGADWANSNPIP
jgi:hypothetical protein